MKSRTTIKYLFTASRLRQCWQPPTLLVLFALALSGCSRSTPPGPDSYAGVIEQASYLLLNCNEGLRILLWDDIPSAPHGNSSTSSTADPQFRQSGDARYSDGRGYDYSFETGDCLQANFAIDSVPYDLSQGKLFLIYAAADHNRVEQFDVDLSSLEPTNAGVQDFGRRMDEIAVMIAGPNSNPDSLSPDLLDADLPSAADKELPPELEPLVAAVLDGDLEARLELVRLSTSGCATAGGLGGPPKCEEDQQERTLVDYLPLGGPGEGSYAGASELAGFLDFEAEDLYAVYVISEELTGDPDYPFGTYALFFATTVGESVVLRVDKEGYIVRLDNLGGFPLDSYFQQKAAGLINPPPDSVIFGPEAAEILVYPPGMTPSDSGDS